jgi:two-component system, LytTR family, response regulator
VKDRDRVLFVEEERVDWVESWGNYVRLFVGGRPLLMRETIGALEARLDPTRFLRVSRTVIVNVERVRELRPQPNGTVELLLAGQIVLRGSRRHRARLQEFFALK